MRAYIGYRRIDEPMMYWRTVGGKFEVDCLVGEQLALEIKGSEKFQENMLSGLLELKAERKFKNYILVSRDPVVRTHQGIEILPFQTFLRRLWAGDLVK
jgi:predicted AAA+ superfamily ATPase